MTSRPDWIEVGQIRKPHGVRGQVQASSSSDNPDRFLPGAVVFVRDSPGAEPRPVELEKVGGTREKLILSLKGVADREAAERLRGAVLLVPGADLPQLDEGEYYPFDLVGLEVRKTSGERIGLVKEVLETPAHDVLSVELDLPARTTGEVPSDLAGPESVPSRRSVQALLVPFVEAAVPDVELEAGYLVVGDMFLQPQEDA